MSTSLSDVFGTHLPPRNEYDRFASNQSVRDVAKELSRHGCLIRLWGPSKSGKSVLCRQVLKAKNVEPIYLHGSLIDTVDEFWIMVAAKLPDRFPDVQDSISPRQKAEILEFCSQIRRPIVIDDFHAIPSTSQTAILRVSKAFTDVQVSVIIISVADVVADVLAKNNQLRDDFDQRTVIKRVPKWESSELQQIASHGFALMGLEVSLPVLQTLSRHSFQNPLLMQAYCEEVCRSMDLLVSQEKRVALSRPAETLKNAFATVAQRNSSFERLWLNGGTHYRLKSGSDANLRALILMAISHIELVQRIRLRGVKEGVRELLADESLTPTIDVIRNAAQAIADIAAENKRDVAVAFVQDMLVITHPFFKVYLLWVLYPNFTGVYPDIATFVEKRLPEESAED